MPGYHTEGDRNRYRGHGQGGMGGWGGRDGGGNRGYSHGGGEGESMTGTDGMMRVKEEAGRDPPEATKTTTATTGTVIGIPLSWQEGGRGNEEYSRRGGGEGRIGPDFIRSLTELGHISGKESRIALDILKSVLSSDAPERDHWDHGPPARKMRRLDWDGARSPHMHKYPYRERPYPGHHQYRGWDQGRAGMVPRSHHCYRKMSNSQLREMEMARSEMPHPDKKEKKDLEKKTSGGVKRVREGDEEKEKASAEETAGEEGTQSTEKEAAEEQEKSEEVKEKNEEQPSVKKETKEEKGEEVKEKKEAETDDTPQANFVFPRTALKCHMCDMTKFPNIKAYLSHLGSKNHERIAHVFHARCAASMDLLIAESKLANKRRTRLRGKAHWCYECVCFMNTHPKEHYHSIEHTLVSRYMEMQCCGYLYNRANVEEHRLSMRHLKNQIAYDEAQQTKKEKEKELRASGKEEEAAFHKEVAEFKRRGLEREKEEGLHPLTVANMPPHDPTRPLGLDMLYKETRCQCDVCHCSISSVRLARYHFRSLEHYHNMCAHFAAIEEAKELERKKKEEEEKAAKAQEEGMEGTEGKAKKKEDAEEEDEDIANMETVDVAEEDGEGEEEDVLGAAAVGGSRARKNKEAQEEDEEDEDGEERMKESFEEEEYPREEEEEEEDAAEGNEEEAEEREGEEEHFDEEMEGEYGEEEEPDDGIIEGLEEEGEDFDEDGLHCEYEGGRDEDA
ncbi:hypothetical protein O3P69_015942 [Scylla paramamosain]|uniref:Uncharacterized protein n=1 Tax=Scylla paramamosain TaxID=85552 RepID=A0AAW0T981_SCYPA